MTTRSDSVPVARCPRCQRLASLAPENQWRPFCSERCRMVDLGGWLKGENAIPGEPALPEHPEDSGETSGGPFH